MNDLISRQEVTIALRESGLCYNNWLEVLGVIDAVQSAKEHIKNDDLIRRQDVLNMIIVAGECEPDLGYTHLHKVIENLPSAEDEDRHYIKIYADDEPSVMAEKLYQICDETHNGEVVKWLKEYFPSVEIPTDLISRQDALDALEEQLDYLQMLNKDENPRAESEWYGVNWARNTIADLPSAEPKTGKWIVNISDYESVCSVCGAKETDFIYGTEMWYGLGGSNYCPNCGAKMRGEEE